MSFCVFLRNKATNCKSDLKLELTYTLRQWIFLVFFRSIHKLWNDNVVTIESTRKKQLNPFHKKTRRVI